MVTVLRDIICELAKLIFESNPNLIKLLFAFSIPSSEAIQVSLFFFPQWSGFDIN
ncbi:hypothetical protein OSCI_2520002 [Kamptonema sp. PCC 6506]|nr:hypothetical protein OSCI_2520002 [Kamptonema sp. PCC 6506]